MSALVIHNTHELHQLKKALPLLRGMHIPQELRIRSRGTERHSASN